MNKKIKMIELLNKIENEEKVPKRIKWGTVNYILRQNSLDGHLYYEKEQGGTSLVTELNTMDDLKSEVEILEDNTEEIEELPTKLVYGSAINGNPEYHVTQKEIVDKINELVKAVNAIRKDKK